MFVRTVMRPAIATILIAAAASARADPKPTLDDFYERTRTRQADFDRCIGYCDGRYLATLLIGGESATPEGDLATGGRIGIDAGIRGDGPDVLRAKLWADVLRIDATGQWLTDLAAQLTAFQAYGEDRDDVGANLSFDGVVARRGELRPLDIAQLARAPYDLVDTEAEVAYLGPKLDKDGHLAIPVGVSNRLRFSEGDHDRRTAISAAIADRAFVRGMRNHAQLDFARFKYTTWNTGAAASTISAGYQRLPDGIDTLPLWALIGYEWAGDRSGVVAQIGMDLTVADVHINPELERHFELDPATNMFARVTSGRLALGHAIGPITYGATYEAATIERGAQFHALTPHAGVTYWGLELSVAYRWMIASSSTLTDRFSVSLDHRF